MNVLRGLFRAFIWIALMSLYLSHGAAARVLLKAPWRMGRVWLLPRLVSPLPIERRERIASSMWRVVAGSNLPRCRSAITRKVTLESAEVTAEDMEPLRVAGWDDAAIYYAITVAALFNFYDRWVSSTGVHAVSHEGHRAHGAVIAERGYVRA